MNVRCLSIRGSGTCATARHGHVELARAQAGQAMIEAFVVCLALCVLWVAAAWLARLQHLGMTTRHAAAFGSFSLARDPQARVEPRLLSHFYGERERRAWVDRSGLPMLADPQRQVLVNIEGKRLPAESLVWTSGSHEARVRNDWRTGHDGVVRVGLKVRPDSNILRSSRSWIGQTLNDFARLTPNLHRDQTVLVDAGHASDDTRIHRVLAGSPVAWSSSADASGVAGDLAAHGLGRADQAWHRPLFSSDWLQPWETHIPAIHLNDSPLQEFLCAHCTLFPTVPVP